MDNQLMVTYWLRAGKTAFTLRQEDVVKQENKTAKDTIRYLLQPGK